MFRTDDVTEVTFHYDNGQSDSFTIPLTPDEFREQVQLLLERPWLTFHLFDETVFVCMARVVKVETKPPMPEIVGIGVFHNSQRVTAMSRGAR
ncbi:hypothetical protein H6G20_13750 [Desertifilum sp. FACHB-1129]|uniref:Uncharacterized protein n=2 Tax=Desertifilum tharense IPPAS B-1220 TaxID=1781255 RepID=A0A1E5QPJ2_9CYAN|nr:MULTISPECIES: hypothetical protein [Desertifilum]MDA0211016.1 hypothetical protein [Cyanobacteria bacterium FC1]MBD2312730.1 hypothetical protein [Desertifilum sp. FACHB-1129]MBD2320211.1 hypothetical protein [Desertifilum sp. FACHB-866]MBD2330339.1 hypothetical protein [Desertifilum sp. FACHB-868]OEJ76524.1 hypothetical protein BH720_04030 [Desertifilum tharense IPPAS B-1220]